MGIACVLVLCLPVLSSRAETDAALAPAVEADPGGDGLLTWWLYSPVQKETLDQAAPRQGAREGAALNAGNGNWALHISPFPFVDFKPYLDAGSGVVWASARIHSASGGPRKLRGGTYCGLRVFVDGKLVLDKPQPQTPFADEAEAQIVLPKGTCELAVAVSIRWGFCGFQLNLTEAALPRPAVGDKIVVPVADKATDAHAAALRALAFIPREPFVKPGGVAQIVAGIPGSLPTGVGPLSAQLVTADGKPAGPPLPPREIALLNRKFWQADYAVPESVGVTHELGLEIKAGGKLLGVKKIELYSLGGLKTATRELAAKITQRAAESGRKLPNAELAVEKLSLFQAKIENGEEKINGELGRMLIDLLNDARSAMELEAQGKDPFEGKTGYFERAYHSRIDESAQPYFIHVPAAFAEKKQDKYPLVVFLHGYVPSYDKHRWWDEAREFNMLMDNNGAFLVIPFGRSNTDFQSCGETDVMDVIAEARRMYPIDSDRIYLYGYSMGGMAVYHIAAHNPDVFAAGVVLAGRADSPLQNHRPLTNFHPYKQWLIHADNPISLCENLLNIPIRIYHGKNDMIISLDEARRMEKRLLEIGGDVKLTTVNGDHFFGFDVMTDDSVLKWLLAQKRKTDPEKRWIKSYSLKYAKQGGVEVSAISGELAPIELKTAKGKLEAASPNIVKSSLGAPAAGFDENALRKTPQLCGPVRDAICGPFLIAYGTTGTPEANARNRKYAERLATEWYEFTRSRAIVKADSEVSDAEKKSKSLFLVGEEQENLLHQAAAPKLPFVVKDGRATLGDRTVPLANRGLMYIYPSPFAAPNTGQYVVVCTGVQYGQSIGANHKFDLLPDFLIYSEQIDTDSTGTNKAFCAGFFDGQWKVDPKLTWWMEK